MDDWMLDEVAHAGSEHLDPTFVAGYDRKAGFDPAEDLATLRAAGIDTTSTVIDLGAGTGGFALAAAAEFGHVVAVDVSMVMLDVLRERASAAGLTNLQCVHGGFLTYEHGGAPVDAVYTRNALHQLPDFWKVRALGRIAHLLKPGGVLRLRDLIYDFRPDESDEHLSRWLEGAVEDPDHGYTRAEFIEHIRTEHSTFRWLFEPMLAATGFEIHAVAFHRAIYGAYTCVRC